MFSKSMSSVGTSGARAPNYLEWMTYPQVERLAARTELALLLRAPELVDRGALDALPANWAIRNISERRAAGGRTFPELGAPEAYCGDPRRANSKTGENLYAALGKFVAEEGASLLRF